VRIKSELDHRIAILLGLPEKRVRVITDAFVDELCNAITEDGGFHLTGFGKLRMKFEKSSLNVGEGAKENMRVKLYFSKAKALRAQIERKFGIHKEQNNG
jgi:nucleoid DNA-binding protein